MRFAATLKMPHILPLPRTSRCAKLLQLRLAQYSHSAAASGRPERTTGVTDHVALECSRSRPAFLATRSTARRWTGDDVLHAPANVPPRTYDLPSWVLCLSDFRRGGDAVYDRHAEQLVGLER